jgi:hypothetical protein
MESPLNRIVFIKLIIGFVIPKIITSNNIDAIIKLSYVSSSWKETIEYYMNDIEFDLDLDSLFPLSKKNEDCLIILMKLNININLNKKYTKKIFNQNNNDSYDIQTYAFWDYAFDYGGIKSNIFWNLIADNDVEFFENWNNETWNKRAERGKISDKYLNKNYTIWYKFLDCIKDNFGIETNKFWEKISKKNNKLFRFWYRQVAEDWGNNIWHSAVRYIKYKVFWENIIQKNNDFFESWNEQTMLGDTVWHAICGYYDYKCINSDIFWEELSKKDDKIFTGWNISNYNINGDGDYSVWYYAFKNVKLEIFWENIAKRNNNFFEKWNEQNSKNYNDWIWAFINLKSELFWREISKKNNLFFLSWDNEIIVPRCLLPDLNLEKTSLWHLALILFESNSSEVANIFWKNIYIRIHKKYINPKNENKILITNIICKK